MKRFIAGAKCPACEKQDTLYFKSEDQYETVYCSRCTYQEKRAEQINDSDEHKEKETLSQKDQSIKWH